MTAAPAITAIAPWFGGKRTLASRIVAELGPHSFYVEPFCGSMAVLLSKPPAAMELVNDLHEDLINLARVLASDRAKDLYERASRVLMHDGLHAEARLTLLSKCCPPASVEQVGARHVRRALMFLITSWQGRNGSSGTKASNLSIARRFTATGGSGGVRWASAVESIPEWHERLRRVSIASMDAFKLLERLADEDGTVVYCDPPYLEKSCRYVHDFEEGDHKRLAESLRRFRKARVVVSYYDAPLVRELYRGWTFVECDAVKSMSNGGKRDRRGAVAAPEILIINGPSHTDGDLFGGAS